MAEVTGGSAAETMEVREGSGKGVRVEGKNGGLLVNKQGQCRDVRAQRRGVLEGGVADVSTLSAKVAAF